MKQKTNTPTIQSSRQIWFSQFKFDDVRSCFADILRESEALLNANPEILSKISGDLERNAMEAKVARRKDRNFADLQTEPFEGFREVDQFAVQSAELQSGRPRMPATLVYYFIFVRGYLGGSIRSKKSCAFISESRSLAQLVQSLDLSMPSVESVSENLNALSEETLEFIWKRQLSRIKDEKLDDYERLYIDSTSVEANTSWPTDSSMILGLLGSVYKISQRLKPFGYENVPKSHCERWLAEMKQLDFEIACAKGKAGSELKRKKLYMRLLNRADKLQAYLRRAFEELGEPGRALPPSQKLQINGLLSMAIERLDFAKQQRAQTYQRIANGKTTPAKERIMSLNDPDCVYISKGSREAVIGYKPSIGRSGEGFVVSLNLPRGNAADSDQLTPLTEETISRTGVVPVCVSVDDGYSSRKGRDSLIELKVKIVSINGSKGKKITPKEDWESDEYRQARLDRSSVESLMFTLKFNYEFGRLGRLGHDSAKLEMLEKILTHNQVRAIERRSSIESARDKAA